MVINSDLEDILLRHPEVAQIVFGMGVHKFLVADETDTVTAHRLGTSKHYKGRDLYEVVSSAYGEAAAKAAREMGFGDSVKEELVTDNEGSCLQIKTLETRLGMGTRKIMGINDLTAAFRDEVTGLWNKNYWLVFAEKHYKTLARESGACVLMIDLDNLHEVDKVYGQLFGDYVLQMLGDVLKTKLRRAGDFVARIGGDEMGVICPSETRENFEKYIGEVIADASSKIREAIIGKTAPSETAVYSGISYGIVKIGKASRGNPAPPFTAVIEQANKKMNEVKRIKRENGDYQR